MPNVIIGGGGGLVGHRLSQLLAARGYQVHHLSRTPDPHAAFPALSWDSYKQTEHQDTWRTADYLLNLAGAGIADKRWTSERKRLIIESRVSTNQTILQAVRELSLQPSALISASAIGYYGDQGDSVLVEESAPGSGFLSKSVQAWEQTVEEWSQTGLRTAAVRIGVVMSTRAGALPKLRLPVRFGLAPWLGGGQQWFSWIHIDDLCRLFIHIMEDHALSGIFNGTAPEPMRLREVMRTLAEVTGVPAIGFPVPSALLKLAMGEMAHTVLDSTRVSSRKAQQTGFEFEFPLLDEALRDVLERKV